MAGRLGAYVICMNEPSTCRRLKQMTMRRRPRLKYNPLARPIQAIVKRAAARPIVDPRSGDEILYGARMKRPVHPGAFIWTEILQPRGLSITTAAKRLGVSRLHLGRVLRGRMPLTPDLAYRIARAFRSRGAPLSLLWFPLLQMQASYDAAAGHKNR